MNRIVAALPSFLRRVAISFAVLCVFSILVFGFLAVSSTWRLSSHDEYYEEALTAFSPAKLLDEAGVHSIAQMSPLKQKFVYKDRLTAADALLNSLALCSTTLGMYLAYGVGMLVLLFLSFSSGSWSGVVAFIVFLLFAPIVALSPLAVWLISFFQPCSPGYALTWLIIGLPAILLGVATSLQGYYLVYTLPVGGGLTLLKIFKF